MATTDSTVCKLNTAMATTDSTVTPVSEKLNYRQIQSVARGLGIRATQTRSALVAAIHMCTLPSSLPAVPVVFVREASAQSVEPTVPSLQVCTQGNNCGEREKTSGSAQIYDLPPREAKQVHEEDVCGKVNTVPIAIMTQHEDEEDLVNNIIACSAANTMGGEPAVAQDVCGALNTAGEEWILQHETEPAVEEDVCGAVYNATSGPAQRHDLPPREAQQVHEEDVCGKVNTVPIAIMTQHEDEEDLVNNIIACSAANTMGGEPAVAQDVCGALNTAGEEWILQHETEPAVEEDVCGAVYNATGIATAQDDNKNVCNDKEDVCDAVPDTAQYAYQQRIGVKDACGAGSNCKADCVDGNLCEQEDVCGTAGNHPAQYADQLLIKADNACDRNFCEQEDADQKLIAEVNTDDASCAVIKQKAQSVEQTPPAGSPMHTAGATGCSYSPRPPAFTNRAWMCRSTSAFSSHDAPLTAIVDDRFGRPVCSRTDAYGTVRAHKLWTFVQC